MKHIYNLEVSATMFQIYQLKDFSK